MVMAGSGKPAYLRLCPKVFRLKTWEHAKDKKAAKVNLASFHPGPSLACPTLVEDVSSFIVFFLPLHRRLRRSS
jgi:hypothetical protein